MFPNGWGYRWFADILGSCCSGSQSSLALLLMRECFYGAFGFR